MPSSSTAEGGAVADIRGLLVSLRKRSETIGEPQESAATIAAMDVQLAQFNVGTLKAPIDHPDTAEFADALAAVNVLAEASPGFVWRLQDDGGDATGIAAYDDPNTIVNMSVWDSMDALRAFAFNGTHRDFLRRRGEWFAPGTSGAVNWWVPAGTLPTVDQAKRRLAFLRAFGPSPYAFGFGPPPPSMVVLRRGLDHSDVAPMIERLNHELLSTEPEEGTCHITLDPAEVEGDNGAFFVAYLDGSPSACGAYRRIGPTTAEVKRMWADPARRGEKLGAAILDTVEAHALLDGHGELKLETGEHLQAAVGLYRKFGFSPCDPWGDYVDSRLSFCMSKQLSRI
jgi:GNAT superfamily N-acetyltransferase